VKKIIVTITKKNLFADIPDELKDELVETMLQSSNFRIERIVSQGHSSPEGFWYDQPDNELVMLLKGSATLRFENQPQPIKMKPGDYIHIEKHVRHRVEWTDSEQDTIWVAVHYNETQLSEA
jgi:cupin 2 domain-containing protein